MVRVINHIIVLSEVFVFVNYNLMENSCRSFKEKVADKQIGIMSHSFYAEML